MTEFYPGQEVVCVDAKPRALPAGQLRLNAHYTVTAVLADDGDGSGVRLAEAAPHPKSCGWFYADRFRPVRDGAIEIFREMCRAVSTTEPTQ